MWVDLQGPGFERRCYGFWDGGDVFRVRVLATAPGRMDVAQRLEPGRRRPERPDRRIHRRRRGARPSRRPIPCAADSSSRPPTATRFNIADGTPFLLLGDTWYAAATNRFRWHDDDRERPIGPAAGFKDYVRLRKSQGFNGVAIIAAFPNWADDGKPWEIWLDQAAGLGVRTAWVNQGDIANGARATNGARRTWPTKAGARFSFPAGCPATNRCFPTSTASTRSISSALDRKIDYLNAQGFIPVIEVARRDITSCWAKYYPWPESYSRYVEYVWSRYQANNCLFSPVHYDWPELTASTPTAQRRRQPGD